jgi:hypothetical protein
VLRRPASGPRAGSVVSKGPVTPPRLKASAMFAAYASCGHPAQVTPSVLRRRGTTQPRVVPFLPDHLTPLCCGRAQPDPPLSAEETAPCFIVREHDSQVPEPNRRQALPAIEPRPMLCPVNRRPLDLEEDQRVKVILAAAPARDRIAAPRVVCTRCKTPLTRRVATRKPWRTLRTSQFA